MRVRLTTIITGCIAALVAAGCGAQVEFEGITACLDGANVAHTTSGPTVARLREELGVADAVVTETEGIIVVVADSNAAAQDMRDELQVVLTRSSSSWVGDDGIPADDAFSIVGNGVIYFRQGSETADAKAVQRCVGLSPDPALLSEDPDIHRGEDVVTALTDAGFHVFTDNQRFSLVREPIKPQLVQKVDWYTTTIWGQGFSPTEGQMQVFVMAVPAHARQLEEALRAEDIRRRFDTKALVYIREGNVLVRYFIRAPDGTDWVDRSDEIEQALAGLAGVAGVDPEDLDEGADADADGDDPGEPAGDRDGERPARAADA